MASQAVEDYVAAIWRITLDGGLATTSEVARRLGVTPASTSHMFKRLAEQGLVAYREYSGVSLTADGERAAAGYVRRHRVIERFLVDLLSIPWDRVDAYADQMEHALPDEVIDRLEAVMDYPDTCPHGHPIPAPSGKIVAEPAVAIAELTPGSHARVVRVDEKDPELLRYLQERGLVPGSKLQLVQRDATGQTLTLAIGGQQHVVGPRVAEAVFVSTRATRSRTPDA